MEFEEEMEYDEEVENEKIYTTMKNVYDENVNHQELQFEKFLITENSDCEELIENSPYPDISNTDGMDIIDSLSNDSSFMSENFTSGYEDWKNMGSKCLNLNDLMRMNRHEKFMLLQLFKKIKGFLSEIQSRIISLEKVSLNEATKESIMYLGRIGAPYFKTKKQKFGSHPNSDTLDRKNKGILSVHHIGFSSKWSKSECENLTRGIMLNYNLNKQRALLKKISSSKQKIEDQTDPKIITHIKDDIEKMEGEIRNLKAIGTKDLPPLSDNKFIDWDYISTEYLRDKHDAQECSSFWRIYLHPHINKSNWSNEENQNIKKLAIKYNEQDWDQIAKELGTNRTAFTVFIHYTSALHKSPCKEKFTKQEDELLLQQIKSKKIGAFIPWTTIAEYFPNRSKTQLTHRYKYYLMNNTQYTNKFSDAEDIMILLLVERFDRNYVLFPKYIPSKSYMQIKSRYDNHLRYKRIKGAFTREDDEQIMSHLSNSDQEINLLASQLNRNRAQIRQRYKILTNFLQKNPDKSLEDVPRKYTTNQDAVRRLAFLKYMVDQFKDEVDIPSLSEIENKLGKGKKLKKKTDIDTLLVEFFSTSYKIKQKFSSTYIHQIKNAAEQINCILNFFSIELEIPADLGKNNTFDIVDIEILNLLEHKKCTDVPTANIHELFPPNINSLLGLRGLLLKNQVYKKCRGIKNLALEVPVINSSKDTKLSSEINSILNEKTENIQNTVLQERHLFLNRFICMFMWPALLSIEPPNKTLLNKEIVLSQAKPCVINKEKRECVRKTIKRKVGPNLMLPPPKKKDIREVKQRSKFDQTVQPTRSSSRLKYKKGITEEIETETETIKHLNKTNEQFMVEQSSSIGSHKKDLALETSSTSETSSYISYNALKKNPIPSNLVRVDKSEIMKLLKQKKPIKIIRIETNNKQGIINGGIPSTIEIIDKVKKIEERNERENRVTDISNIEKPIQPGNNSNTILQNDNPLDFDKIKQKFNFSFKKKNQSLLVVPDEKSKHGSSVVNDNNKQSFFAHSSEKHSDGVVDLTEEELMKNEVDQLDQLIKQEGSFDLL